MAVGANKLMAEVWQQNIPLFRERLQTLEAMAAAAAEGPLSDPQRQEAEGIAHQFAGSLGMFGFPLGTLLARELEAMLARDETLDAPRCAAIVAELRAMLPLSD